MRPWHGLLLAAVLLIAAGLWACGSGPAAPASRARGIVWAVGDGAIGGNDAKAVARRIAAGHADRLLYLGDVYGSSDFGEGSAEAFQTNFESVYGALVNRIAPTPGNHEWPARDMGYRPFWQQASGRRQPDYYAFRVGGWEILSLNSEGPHDESSPQVRWLQSQLSEPGTCRLAFWHRPRFSAGLHGDQVDVQPLWDALSGHARIVVNGHDHDLQRLRPVAGITEFVAGGGGAPRYPLEDDARLAFGDDEQFGALRVELRPGRADYAFVAVDGRRLDSGRLGCRPLVR